MTEVTIVDPYSELQTIELSHPWGHGVPSYPGQDDVKMFRAVKFAQHGVMAHRIEQDGIAFDQDVTERSVVHVHAVTGHVHVVVADRNVTAA